MSKNPNSRSKPVKQNEPMTGAMKFFVASCFAELYLLIIRRCYINGDAMQQIAWFDHYFKVLIGAGAAVLVLGAILSAVLRADKKKRIWGWSITGLGAFVAIASALVWKFNTAAMTFLCVLVPVVMLLGIFWSLYDRECALSLTILGAGLLSLWVCSKSMSNVFLGTYVKIGAVLFLVILAAIAWLVKQGKLEKLLPATANPLPVYVACGLSALGIVIAFLSTSLAYYTMWGMAIVVFALAVYYTVQQL